MKVSAKLAICVLKPVILAMTLGFSATCLAGPGSADCGHLTNVGMFADSAPKRTFAPKARHSYRQTVKNELPVNKNQKTGLQKKEKVHSSVSRAVASASSSKSS
jgi:hypothetical protein